LRHDALIFPIAVGIAGVHFFLFARVLDTWQYYVTGILDCLAVAITLLLALPLLVPAAAQGAPDCAFVLGFATLHDLIPSVVGGCVDDEQHNPANGDALQQTTQGLLVWRKADNFTAFTDGYHSWVNGPYGVQERLNGQRFAWEANPQGLPVIGVPVPLAHLDGLDSLLSIVQMPAGVPVATVSIGGARNAGLLAIRILGATMPALRQAMERYQASLADTVRAKDAAVQAEFTEPGIAKH
jgi:hypothetical protein